MATSTAVNGWAIPELGDAANITALNATFSAIDQRVTPIFSTATARNSAISSPTFGQMAAVSGTGELYMYDGTNWVSAKPRYRYCTADQGVTDNAVTLISSTYLTIPVEASSVYIIDGSFRTLNSTFANDVRYGTLAPSGSTGSWSILQQATDDSWAVIPAVSWNASHTYGGSSAGSVRSRFQGTLLTSVTSGAMTIQFCEAVNSAGTSTVTLCADSWIKLEKIA